MFGIYLDDTVSLARLTPRGHGEELSCQECGKPVKSVRAPATSPICRLSVLGVRPDRTPSTPHAGRALSSLLDEDLKSVVLRALLQKGSADQRLYNKTDCHLPTICFHEGGRRITIRASSKVLYIFFRHLSVVRLPKTPPPLHLSLTAFQECDCIPYLEKGYRRGKRPLR